MRLFSGDSSGVVRDLIHFSFEINCEALKFEKYNSESFSYNLQMTIRVFLHKLNYLKWEGSALPSFSVDTFETFGFPVDSHSAGSTDDFGEVFRDAVQNTRVGRSIVEVSIWKKGG